MRRHWGRLPRRTLVEFALAALATVAGLALEAIAKRAGPGAKNFLAAALGLHIAALFLLFDSLISYLGDEE